MTAVGRFLRGRPRARTNGAPARVDWARMAAALGEPARPELDRVLALVADEDDALRDDLPLGKAHLLERLCTQGLIPEDWGVPRATRSFQGDEVGGTTAFVDTPVWWMVLIASLGARTLQTLDALLVEACHHRGAQADPPLVVWTCAWSDKTEDDAVYAWLRELNALPEAAAPSPLDGKPWRSTAMVLALSRDLGLKGGGAEAAERLRACIQAADDAMANAELLTMAGMFDQSPAENERSADVRLVAQRLWNLALLEAAEATGAPSNARVGVTRRTRQELLGVLRPLGSLYGLGVFPGDVQPSKAEILVPGPDEPWLHDLMEYEDVY